MLPTDGTGIIDVSGPTIARIIGSLKGGASSNSHKVRVVGNLMVTNREISDKRSADPYSDGGLAVWDAANPSETEQLGSFVEGIGAHRFDFDGRYAYILASTAGYQNTKGGRHGNY